MLVPVGQIPVTGMADLPGIFQQIAEGEQINHGDKAQGSPPYNLRDPTRATEKPSAHRFQTWHNLAIMTWFRKSASHEF